ncbi:MAG: formylglycine-generating enzyme family protein [Planctomycetota bacterium]
MMPISAGKFTMGSYLVEKDSSKSKTQHKVTLTKSFYMGKYEVTQGRWEALMGNNPSIEKGAKLPVTGVSWDDCQEFIKKLNSKTNGGYRLPTEAEWEYSCRAGTTTEYSFGDSLTKSDANYGDGEAGAIKLGGSYKPNSFGLYDMHGNVWEWVEDRFGDYPAGAVTDPTGPAKGELRVFRGGSFFGDGSQASSSNRRNCPPTDRALNVGFRLARTDFSEEGKQAIKEKKSLQNKEEVKVKQHINSKILLIEKEMVLIKAGKFKMGSPASEFNRSNDEIQHEVILSKSFLIGRYEVTQEDWLRVMGNSPSRDTGVNLPVTNVSWEDCQGFINELNTISEGGYRLPTEAEWEYACRAGANTSYSHGDNIKKSDLNYQGQSIKIVGTYNPNAFGLYDMHGNVWEWCEDRYGTYPTESVTDPKGPAVELARVLRGGSFLSLESATRSSGRSKNLPTSGGIAIGFRLARTP